jgi:cytochrome P450
MANLTITVDTDILQRARQRALSEGRSVNAIIREYLEAYSGHRRDRLEALSDLLSIAKASEAASGGRRWTRDELHERS